MFGDSFGWSGSEVTMYKKKLMLRKLSDYSFYA